MNRKGEINVRILLTIFIGIIVALILLQGISPYLGQARNSVAAINYTYAFVNDSAYHDMAGQELLSTPIVTNASADAKVIDPGNYTIDEGVSATTGVKTIQFNWSTLSERSGLSGASMGDINISYTYGADGYIDNSAGRSMVLLIPIFAALAVLVFTLYPTLRSDILNKFGK